MDYNQGSIDLDSLHGIPSKDVFEKLLSDSTFVNYLNTFLSLPVFGKRLIYNRAEDTFSIDPPPPRTCYHLPRYRIKKWVRKERLQLFWKTDLFIECLLCSHLHDAAESSRTSLSRDQTRTYLGTVDGMRNFHLFLRGTAGHKILLFWIDAERFRRVTKRENRRFAFREVQAKYLQSGSPRELPEVMKWVSICGGTPGLERKSSFKFPKSITTRMYSSEASIFSENVFIPVQKMALERLINYWVPKYIEHKKIIRNLINEKRRRQSEIKPNTNRVSPVPEMKQDISVVKTKSDEELADFMEMQCVSSTESLTETATEEEIRAKRLEEWKRWFWEGVDDNGTESEAKVEPPEDMPQELRQLGGIRGAPPSSPATPEAENTSLNVVVEGEEESCVPNPSSDAESEEVLKNSQSFYPPKECRAISTATERSVSEPALPTPYLMIWLNESQEAPAAISDNEEDDETLEEKRGNLPKLRPPYAKIPSSAPRKLKTMYEALALEKSTITEEQKKELYESSSSSISSESLLSNRSLSVTPPRSALLALKRVSASRVIPFEEVGHEIAAMVSEPRNLYPRDTAQGGQLILSGSNNDMNMLDKLSLSALVALTADKLAGGPLREYLQKTEQNMAFRSLQFWEDAQRYLSPMEDFGSYNKFHFAKTLIATYIAPDSPRQVDMSPRMRNDLMRFLPHEKGDYLLSNVVKNCVQALALPWSEYVRSDVDHFINTVLIQRKSDIEKKDELLYSDSSDQTWRALKLAVGLGVSGFSIGQDDEDKEECEARKDDSIKIPSLKDYEREMQMLNARSRRASHFYGQVTRQDEDAPEGSKKVTGVKIRPPKPRGFNDILHDNLQLMWFKRFLSEKQCEAPLLFWQAVENMKMNCKDGKARQAKATVIVKKYFINISTSAAEYLHCKADIIRDIPLLEKTTPPMLVSAQACVARSMEENWYADYLDTFPDDDNDRELFQKYALRNTLAGVYKMAAHGKTKGMWAMFAHNVMSFQRGIANRGLLQEFEQFLKKESAATVEFNLRRHSLHPTRRMINSKVVNTDRLISDLEFWMEVTRFKEQADNAAECARSGNYTLDDENLLLEKAKTIVKCFIDSDIPPRIQINISNDLADNIIGLVQNGIVERGLFHEAALSVFTSLIFCWKKFIVERITEPEEEEQPLCTDKAGTSSRKRIMSLIAGIPYRKIYVPSDEDVFWSFSLSHGLRLTMPLKCVMTKRVATQLEHRSAFSDRVTLSRPTL